MADLFNQDFQEFIEALNIAKVEYILVEAMQLSFMVIFAALLIWMCGLIKLPTIM